MITECPYVVALYPASLPFAHVQGFGCMKYMRLFAGELLEAGVYFRYVIDRDNGKTIPHVRVFGHDQIGFFG
jgi:hypothetical protein